MKAYIYICTVMGKDSQQQQQESGLALKNHSPGCMWGILHHFHHHINVKKRLPHKRHHSTGRNPPDPGNVPEASGTRQKEDSDPANGNSAGEAKQAEPRVQSPKTSMKSKIRAKISLDMSKRKGHRRSSSYPVRTTELELNEPTHQGREPSTSSAKDGLFISDYNNNNARFRHSSASDPRINDSNNSGSCEACTAAMQTMKYLKQSEVSGELGREPVRDHTILQDRSIYAIEPSKRSSIQESKLFMDALDLLDMRKEVFLKILQDPSSSLAQHLHRRHTSSKLKGGLTKSVSFPAHSSSEQTAIKHGGGDDSDALVPEDGDSIEHLSKALEPIDDALPNRAHVTRKKHDGGKAALKGFKNLGQKIKHVIKDRKKEKNRIIMDGILHKIHYGRKASKGGVKVNERQELKDVKFSKYSPKSEPLPSSDPEKAPIGNKFARTSSFNESFDRYKRLLEDGSGKDEKDRVSDQRLRLRTADTISPIPTSPAALKRILSLPDIRAYSSLQGDESPSTTGCFHSHVRTNSVGSSGMVSDQRQLVIIESESRDNLFDVGETFEESIDSKTWETASSHYEDSFSTSSALQQSKTIEHLSEDAATEYHENEIEHFSKDSELALLVQQHLLLSHLHVDAKNEAEFNYVRDVLDLSGFTRDEILGKWHSTEQPLDPSMFDEVRGCFISQPECNNMSEEHGTYDHLLLFDLINEALLNIYEKSYSYWPMPLNNRSYIHRMPMGQHVLGEVWTEISWLLNQRPELDQSMDDMVGRDLSKSDGWMNLQFDAECVGLEVEELLFDDLLEEIIFV